MNKICKNCKHAEVDSVYAGLYNCTMMLDINWHEPIMVDDENKQTVDLTRAYSWDYESYKSGNYVGAYFGCIHFKEKDNE